jgi:DNA modification methylase
MTSSKTGVCQNGAALPKIEHIPVDDLKPYAGNARTHSRKQIKQIAASIERFGFTNPVLISDVGEIIAGHGRVSAARLLDIDSVPVLRLSHLSEDERRAYVLADNKLAENAGWDAEILAIELQALVDLDFQVDLTGFEIAEIDLLLGDAAEEGRDGLTDDIYLRKEGPAMTQPGDVWELGPHRLFCGDAQSADDLKRLMDGERAQMIFADPPYNVPISGHVSGLGKQRHREFAFASGERAPDIFTSFLEKTLGNMVRVAQDGAIAFVCMDWRHMRELLVAGGRVFTELKNLCVWNKTNAGMGTFYRSKHELVFAFKVGTAPHINSFGLGETGRYRTNVWDYAGANVLGAERDADLAMHPTVKPIALIADAIKDCSRRNDIILDTFAGSGSTLIAADTCGRKARVMEIDPVYCDTIIRRYMAMTGLPVVLQATGQSFEDVAQIDASLNQTEVSLT